MAFLPGGSEAMRIDSSGNLLVGTTSTSASVAGGRIFSTGRLVTSVNDEGHYIRRNNSDGSLIDFAKDGTTVGSIGTTGSQIYIGTGASGLFFNSSSNQIYPLNTSTQANEDGTQDLGRTTARFKDLYLSGGVYLGGTGAANKLDDYEEGTWTPTLVGNTTAGSYTVTATECVYTKVGRMVHVKGRLTFTVNSAGTGIAKFGGLPFIASGGSSAIGTVRSNGIDYDNSTLFAVTAQWTSNSSDFSINQVTDNGGGVAFDIGGVSSTDYIDISITYATT
jgi:hypothetical protein